MATCRGWEALLERYHDGELERTARLRVERHLQDCEGCRGSLEALRRLGKLVAQSGLAAAERADLSGLWDQLAARIAAEAAVGPGVLERLRLWHSRFWRVNRRAVVAAAAACFVTLAVAIPVMHMMGSGASEQALVGGTGIAANEVVVESLQGGEHDIVLINVHPEDMTTVIWLLGRDEDTDADSPGSAQPQPDLPGSVDIGTECHRGDDALAHDDVDAGPPACDQGVRVRGTRSPARR